MKRFLIWASILVSVPIFAATAGTWKTGKLVDLQRYETGAGAALAQAEYCFAVELEDTVYLARYQPYWRHSYDPTTMTVGDPVEVVVHGNKLILKKPDGKELTTRISRRERVSPDKHPTSCALQVQPN